MKRITIILLSLILLLSTLLQGCADDMTGGEQSGEPEEETPITPVEPRRVSAGKYVFDAENILNYEVVVCDCAVNFPLSGPINVLRYYKDEFNFPSYTPQTFIDEQNENVTEFDVYGEKIQIKYNNSYYSCSGGIVHNFDKIIIDENGKIDWLLLEYSADDDEADKERITEEEAKEAAVRFVEDYTYLADASSCVLNIINSNSQGCCVVEVIRTLSGVKTTERINVGVDIYTGKVNWLKTINKNLFSEDITFEFDKERIEAKVYEYLDEAVSDTERIEDLPYEELFGLNGKDVVQNNGNDSENNENHDDIFDDEKYYVSKYEVDKEKTRIDYVLTALPDRTMFLKIEISAHYKLLETDPQGNTYTVTTTGDHHTFCIFPDGSAVVQAQNQEAAEKPDGSQAQ